MSTPTLTRAAAPPRRRASLDARMENRDGLTMIAPTALIILVVIVIPIGWNVVLAFQDTSLETIAERGITGSPTFDNIVRVLTASGFWSSLWTTVVYSVAATAGSVAVGLAAALAFRRPFRSRGLLRAFMLLPYVAPVVAVAFVWEMLLNPQYGLVNTWGTSWLGWDEPVDFLGQEPFALLTVIAFEIWRYFPFAFMFLTARLVALPVELEEAARVDGATPSQTFRHVIFPQLVPTIALLCLLRLIMTFNKFDDVYLLTGGTAGTEIAPVRVYDQLTGNLDIGGAAANALVLAVVLALFLTVYMRFFGRKEQDG
ncbi:carbohydrate ABC transporter permease [Nocardioides albus]|uniref:Multiple sugar transport system permease protein n=1 Tax=Nocardioides albus TaxID=1841 RepID=A0A7W5A235_9ACTN|nr:sugar ABC transporter permease [Nocardioides albus]MBB3087929.1 multiple sugar transport system permease protein [Nocardioides albus]GGU21381.1 transporter [Nocardioides albus]